MTIVDNRKKLIGEDLVMRGLNISKRKLNQYEEEGKLIVDHVNSYGNKIYKRDSFLSLYNPAVFGENSNRHKAIYIRADNMNDANRAFLHIQHEECAKELNPMRDDRLDPVDDREVFWVYSDYGYVTNFNRQKFNSLIYDITKFNVSEVCLYDDFQFAGNQTSSICKFLSEFYDMRFIILHRHEYDEIFEKQVMEMIDCFIRENRISSVMEESAISDTKEKIGGLLKIITSYYKPYGY